MGDLAKRLVAVVARERHSPRSPTRRSDRHVVAHAVALVDAEYGSIIPRLFAASARSLSALACLFDSVVCRPRARTTRASEKNAKTPVCGALRLTETGRNARLPGRPNGSRQSSCRDASGFSLEDRDRVDPARRADAIARDGRRNACNDLDTSSSGSLRWRWGPGRPFCVARCHPRTANTAILVSAAP